MRELYLRWREPINTFWRRMLITFGAVGTMAATVTDLLPAIMHDEFVPDEWKTSLRMVYAACLFGAMLSKLTVSSTEKLNEKKHKSEFNDKIN